MRSGEHLGHVAAQLVHRRHDDVAGRLVVELLDALAEVGLDHLDAAVLEEGPHVAFLGQHRLALDQRARRARQDVEDDLVVLGRVARPVHVRAVLDRVALELLEIVGEMGERVLLDRGGQRAQLFPFRNAIASRSRFLRRSQSRLSWKSTWSLAAMNLEDASAWSMRFMRVLRSASARYG